jgi:hypothetical protein
MVIVGGGVGWEEKEGGKKKKNPQSGEQRNIRLKRDETENNAKKFDVDEELRSRGWSLEFKSSLLGIEKRN